MAQKIQIDPAHPVGSLTAGEQQFTIAADTDHSQESIHKRVVDDIPEMARNGVKHIMIEYPADSLKTLESRYPEMATAKTWDERRKVLDDYGNKAYQEKMAAGVKEAQGLDPEKDKDKWSAAYQRGTERYEKENAVAKRDLENAEFDLKTQELLEKVYSKPPGISDDGIREASRDYIGASAENKKQSADNFAEMLIQSRNAGIQVHFTGDRGDTATKVGLAQAEEALQQHDADNQKYADLYKQSKKDPNLKISPQDEQGLVDYMTKAAKLTRDVNNLQAKSNGDRDDPVREQKRVDGIIEAAKGEKSVIVWGSAHSGKENDFNEMLDARLRAQAEQAGAPPPADTRVIQLYASKADKAEMDRNPDRTQTDEPDARYYIKEGTLEITPSGKDTLIAKTSSVDPVQQQYAELMGSHVVGSVKSQPASSDPVEPNRPVAAPVVAPTA